MNKTASNQLKDALKNMCFDIYDAIFWKIPTNRVPFLEQSQGLSMHLYQKNPAKVFIKDFDYNRFSYTHLDKFFSLGGCLPNKHLGHFFSVTFLRKASLI